MPHSPHHRHGQQDPDRTGRGGWPRAKVHGANDAGVPVAGGFVGSAQG